MVNTEFFLVVFSFIWSEYGDLRDKSPYSVRIQEKCGSEKNSIFGHFSRSVLQTYLKYEYRKRYVMISMNKVLFGDQYNVHLMFKRNSNNLPTVTSITIRRYKKCSGVKSNINIFKLLAIFKYPKLLCNIELIPKQNSVSHNNVNKY